MAFEVKPVLDKKWSDQIKMMAPTQMLNKSILSFNEENFLQFFLQVSFFI